MCIKGKRLPVILLFIFLSIYSYGQQVRLFSTDAELSNSLIGDLIQDHRGIMWIATEEGINCYDGSKFSYYKEEDGILNNFVRSIFKDSKENLYFGYLNGLQVYKRESDSFEKIPLILESGNEFPAHVFEMVELSDGTLLIGTSGHGIFSLSPSDSNRVAKQKPGIVPSSLVNYLFEDNNKNLWVSTQDLGLFKISRDEQSVNYFDPKNGLDNNVTSICQDKSGTLYVSSLRKGLFKYNPILDSFEKIPNHDLSTQPIKELHLTQNDQLLIGTEGQGLKIYDPKKNQISDLNFKVSNFDFSKSKIHKIIEDDDGNIWLGLFQKGVVLIPSRSNNFNYIGYQSTNNNIIGSNYIMSVYKDKQGILWVGTDSDGLYSISKKGVQLAHYTHSDKKYPAPSTIISIYEDSFENLWIGSYLEGLFRFDRKNGALIPVKNILDNKYNPIQHVFSMVEDDNKTLWIATLGNGLYSMDLQTNEIKNYGGIPNPAHPNKANNTIHNSWLSDLLITKDKLYIGSMDGVSCFDMKTRTFTNINNICNQLHGESVLSLHQDGLERIWIGTTHGLHLLNEAESTCVNYTIKDGLPNNVICAIESDDDHNLWLSTNYGISKFNPNDTTFLNYYYHDGLQGNEFSKRAVFKDDMGTLIFGGINGITYFKPEDIKDNPKKLEVILTGFYLNDVAVKKGMKSGKYDIVDTAVMDAQVFRLAHNDNSFTLEFSSMEYVNPKRITYLYSVNDKGWISLQRGINSITFNDLEPGNYNFKVKAKDFTAYSDIRSIDVIIHPAWYFSTWAILGYIIISFLIILGIGYLIYQKYETRKKIREHRHAEQINEAKLEFFTNISHEIRSPLSLILNPLKKLITTDEDIVRQAAYNRIKRNTERVLHLINQLMDMRKIDKGKFSLRFSETDIVKFIKGTTDIFQEQIHEKGIEFKILHEIESPMVWIDQNFFDKTIHNLLSNAIKFTPQNGKISISISTQEVGSVDLKTHVLISCSDTGIGLKKHELTKIFDRFYQASNNKHETIGNGIGLHLARSIVELHNGTIKAENNSNGIGCTFVISLPLGKEHLDPEQLSEGHLHSEVNGAITSIPPLPFEGKKDEISVKAKSKKNVLVVDDDEEVRQYICRELASEYHMNNCTNGKEALTYSLEKKPDLIISDVVMSEMDGITFCRKLKQNVNTNHIPIILLTARTGDQANLEGLGIGADAFISKPFNMEILRKTAENIIKTRDLLKNNYNGSQFQSDKVKNIIIESTDEKLMRKIMGIINTNIDNTDLNVEMIAAEIGISRVHLYRKLKEITNQSVRDLIRNIRLKQAAELLSTKNLNISEVAYATGFSNPSKFSTSFKEVYGVSPKVYMEQNYNGPSTFKENQST